MKSWNCVILHSFFWESEGALQEADVSFVPMMLRRRCSELTKLCFSASRHCIQTCEQVPVISVSKYGEIQRQYVISKKLIETKEVSPTAFSFSVFNTAIALLGISLKNHASALALCTMYNQLEAGFVHALSFLENHPEEEKLLLLIGEERLPEPYQRISSEKNIPFIAAFLLSLRGNGYTVRLRSSQTQDKDRQRVRTDDNARIIEENKSLENYDQCKRFICFVQNQAEVAIHVNKLEILKNE